MASFAGFHKFAYAQRYLMFLSHVGYEFRGMQKQLPMFYKGKQHVVKTVQETLETALESVLKTRHTVKVHTSSRTDAGVHALRTAVYVHLMQRDVLPSQITSELNKHFMAEEIGIRIQSTQCVPDNFSPRWNALTRSYTYRFAIRKTPLTISSVKHLAPIPFSEHKRTLFIQNSETDIIKMKEAAALIHGTRNYFSFMGRPKQFENKSTIKSIYSLTISPAAAFMPEHDLIAKDFNFWHVTCIGRSFLYRQIRRIVGVLLAVGQEKMDLDGVRKLINEPCVESWDPKAVCVPPWGLYLTNITYNPVDVDPTIVSTLDFENHLDPIRTTYALQG